MNRRNYHRLRALPRMALVLMLATVPLLADDNALETVKEQIVELSAISGGEVGVAVEHLESGHAFSGQCRRALSSRQHLQGRHRGLPDEPGRGPVSFHWTR